MLSLRGLKGGHKIEQKLAFRTRFAVVCIYLLLRICSATCMLVYVNRESSHIGTSSFTSNQPWKELAMGEKRKKSHLAF